MRSAVKVKEKQDQGIPVHKSIKDRLCSVLVTAVEERSKEKEKYIHGVTAWPEAMCIVGLPYQFHDIAFLLKFSSVSSSWHRYNFQPWGVLCNTNGISKSNS